MPGLRQQGFLEERLVPGVRRRLMTRLDLQALARALAGAGRAATRRGAAAQASQAPARGPGSPHHSATGRPGGRAKSAKQQRPNPPTMAGATVRCT